jgi:uncharacterized protein (TIGR00251 family)
MARKFTNGKYGSALPVRVTPRSSRNEIVGIMNDNTVKIKLTAPPVDGKANQQLIIFLADVLRVPKSSVNIVAGESGRDKLVSILDLDTDEVHKKLLEYIK